MSQLLLMPLMYTCEEVGSVSQRMRWNPSPLLELGGGLDGAIHAAAGPQLLAELKQLVPHRTNIAQVVMTKGYKTGFQHILHVAGPIYSSAKKEESRRLLEATYANVIKAADRLEGLTELGIASISTGIYGYPLKDAAPLAIETVARELSKAEQLRTVIFAMFKKEEFDIFNKAYADWERKKSEDL